MKFMPQIGSKFIYITLGLILFDITVYSVLFHIKRRKKRSEEVEDCAIFHCGVYPCGTYCPEGLDLSKKDHAIDCVRLNIKKLTDRIKQCKTRIDIALFLIPCEEICCAIAEQVKLGRVVRMITDGRTYKDHDPGLSFQEMLKQGLRLKKTETSFHFHHKFIIIDERILIQGSCNLTMSALYSNCDNFLITSNKELVQAYVQYYKEAWNEIS